jgi:hypothetical protein
MFHCWRCRAECFSQQETVVWMCSMFTLCNRVFIPDENLVWCPEKLMSAVLAHAHYLPDSYRGQAHTNRVREEFSQLFHYKAVSSQLSSSQLYQHSCHCYTRIFTKVTGAQNQNTIPMNPSDYLFWSELHWNSHLSFLWWAVDYNTK